MDFVLQRTVQEVGVVHAGGRWLYLSKEKTPCFPPDRRGINLKSEEREPAAISTLISFAS